MNAFFNKLWGWPSRYRTAYSLTLGIVFGLAIPFSSFWYLLLMIVFFLRTHCVSAGCGWSIGFALYLLFNSIYEPVGKWLLLAYPDFWQKLFSIPILSCFDLRYADVMGSVICAFCATIITILVITIYRIFKNYKRGAL